MISFHVIFHFVFITCEIYSLCIVLYCVGCGNRLIGHWLVVDIGWLVLSRLRHEVLGIYLQLQARSEQCTMLLAQCVSSSPPSATATSSTTATTAWTVASQWRASLPRAEALMLQEALRQEQAADMEEILGHVDR